MNAKGAIYKNKNVSKMHIPLYGALKRKKGHTLAVHWGIAPKISKDLYGILSCQISRWSVKPGRDDCDWTK